MGHNLSISLAAIKTKSEINIEITHRIGQGDTVAAVVIEVVDKRNATKPLGIVPYQTGTRNKIKIQILDVHPKVFTGNALSLGMPITDRRHTGNGEEAILGKDPVVGITAADAVMAVVQPVEFQRFHHRDAPLIGRIEHLLGQEVVIKLHLLLVKTDTENPRTAALALHRALGKGGRIGEALVIEDIIGIETGGIGIKTAKDLIPHVGGPETVDATYLKISGVSNKNPVNAKHRTVQAQIEFG